MNSNTSKTSAIKEYDANFKIQSLSESIEKLTQSVVNSLKHNSEYIELLQTNKKLQENFSSLSSQKQNIEQQLKTKTEEISSLSKSIESKEDDIKKLETINSKLKLEASKYQSALGAATIYQLGDDDNNNSVRLNNDIVCLQDNLEKYVTNLRPKIKIDYVRVNNLFTKYQCDLKMDHRIKDLTLIKAVLQRHVIETIYQKAVEYFKNVKDTNKPQSLESEINSKVNEIITLMDKFAKTRFESSSVTSAVPIKIRQQIFASLSNNGFSDIINDEQLKIEHNFISNLKKHINHEMECYRKISDDKTKKKIEEMAGDIIREVVRLFFFRLNIQEPTAKWKWFNHDDKFNSIQMIGSRDEDDGEDEAVELCIFPLIYRDSGSSSSELQVNTPAKVCVRDSNSSEESKEENKGVAEGNSKNSKNEKPYIRDSNSSEENKEIAEGNNKNNKNGKLYNSSEENKVAEGNNKNNKNGKLYVRDSNSSEENKEIAEGNNKNSKNGKLYRFFRRWQRKQQKR